MKKQLIFIAILSSALISSEHIDLKEELLKSFDEVTEIATKTKLNIDDVPSFVTVLHRTQLQKIGIDNLFEALSLVPGVQLSKESTGVPIVVFRGAMQKGEVKFMIDGVEINNTYRGSVYYYLDFPIEMIERIEVVRGAGSVLYGSGAISGVVNVITRSMGADDTGNLFASAGGQDHYKSGGVFSEAVGSVRLIADGYYEKDHKKIATGPDRIGTSGDSDQGIESYSLGFAAVGENLSFKTRMKFAKFGNSHGVEGFLDESSDKYFNSNEAVFAELSYKDYLSNGDSYRASVGYDDYSQDAEIRNHEGLDAKYKERRISSRFEYISKAFKNNELLLGVEYSYAKQIDESFILSGRHNREVGSLYVNDSILYSDVLNISVGARYHYSDGTDNISPSVGALYKYSETLNIKATYTGSFRSPSWIELSSNSNLQPEKAKTYEVGFIYRPDNLNRIGMNAYHTDIENEITKDGTAKYENFNESTMNGVEVEYSFNPSLHKEYKLSATYLKAKDRERRDIAGVANVLIDAYMTQNITSNISFGMLAQYVSEIHRPDGDSRDKLDDMLTLDATLSYSLKDFTASVSIKNIFDDAVRYPLPENIYFDDYNDAGRVAMVKICWNF